MSNPINSLKKIKKSPLFLPDMAKNSSKSVSAYDSWAEKSDLKEKSPRYMDLNMGYVKNSPRSINNSSRLASTLNKHPLLGDIPSNAPPYKSKIDDSDLIDEFTTKMAADSLKRSLLQTRSISTDKNSKTAVPTDMDLMQIMMGKIKATETRCAFLERQNREKDKTIRILQEKLNIMKQSNEQPKDILVEKLEEKNLELEGKICEMEDFLSDYGLVWIGNKSLVKGENSKAGGKNYYTDGKFRIDYDLMLKHIKELNSLMDESNSDREIVEFRPNGAKFETSSNSIKLTLYSNGIALYEGPFRSFQDSLTQKFCIDIMDGYFPSELQPKHPDGVRLHVVDKRDVTFRNDRSSNSVFKSKGYRLGSGRVEPVKSDILELDGVRNVETQISEEKPLTIDQFLQKLPNCVVRNGGNLVDIRNDLSNLIRGTPPPPTTTTTTAPESQFTISSSLNRNDFGRSSDQDELERMASLRVTSGEESYLVRLRYTDTIEMLKDHIKSIRRTKSQSGSFDLASIHPRKILDNVKLTLEQCDLVPNSNILLIPHRKNSN